MLQLRFGRIHLWALMTALRLLIMSPLNYLFGHGSAEQTGDNLSRIAMGNVPGEMTSSEGQILERGDSRERMERVQRGSLNAIYTSISALAKV